MRLFSKLFGNKEEKEFLACAKVLCMVAAADKKIIEKEIDRKFASLEFLGFDLDKFIPEEDKTIGIWGDIWKEALEISEKIISRGPLLNYEEVKKRLGVKNITSYEKRIKLLFAAAKIAKGKTTFELDREKLKDMKLEEELHTWSVVHCLSDILEIDKEQAEKIIMAGLGGK